MALKEFVQEVKSLNSDAGIQLTNADTRTVIDNVFKALTAQTSIRIPNFGAFKLKTRAARAARVGRNPSTGEALNIAAKPATQFLAFKQSK